ncbi:MAG: hypothetical protein M1819_004654 [Sarea resinae]|nr:MAG: hypothetical protein M1819_004654 [Sarea resinae]
MQIPLIKDLHLQRRLRPQLITGILVLAFVLVALTYRLQSSSNPGAPAAAAPQFRNPKPFQPRQRFDGVWDYRRDARDLLLSPAECDAAFPGLFEEVERAVKDRMGKNITVEEVDAIPKRNGYVRAMVFDQELYIISTQGKIYSRGMAVLHALHRALITSPTPLPNIEFTFSVDDWLPPQSQWAFARKTEDRQTWLMPDFGYWSWPETKVGAYGEVQRKAIEMEQGSDEGQNGGDHKSSDALAPNPSVPSSWSWGKKVPRLLWRGATMSLPLREALVRVAASKPWADVKALDWHDKSSMSTDLKSMSEHCQYKYLMHTEGNSYSGRLKYLQNCRSVIVAHDMDWLQHQSPLMASSGPGQNYVKVRRDFEDLEASIQALLKDDKKAEKIAENNVRTFRERYLTPAAEVCYWRRLIQGWANVSFEPRFYDVAPDGTKKWRGVPFESYALEGRLEWDPY